MGRMRFVVLCLLISALLLVLNQRESGAAINLTEIMSETELKTPMESQFGYTIAAGSFIAPLQMRSPFSDYLNRLDAEVMKQYRRKQLHEQLKYVLMVVIGIVVICLLYKIAQKKGKSTIQEREGGRKTTTSVSGTSIPEEEFKAEKNKLLSKPKEGGTSNITTVKLAKEIVNELKERIRKGLSR